MLIKRYVVYITGKILRWHQFLKGVSRYLVSEELFQFMSLYTSRDK